jgi:hypothetical protein
MDYLHQHSSSLQSDKKLDFRTPREKKSQDTRTSKHEKRKDRTTKDRTERSKERKGKLREHRATNDVRSRSRPQAPSALSLIVSNAGAPSVVREAITSITLTTLAVSRRPAHVTATWAQLLKRKLSMRVQAQEARTRRTQTNRPTSFKWRNANWETT